MAKSSSDPGSRVVRRRVVVTGRVQGVFFRESCRRLAVGAKVAGFVRNLADGSVEAVFEGTAQSVGRLVAWCRTGPDTAVVDTVTVIEEEPEGEARFLVR